MYGRGVSRDAKLLRLVHLDTAIHRREAFTCGESSLDDYLKNRASQDARRYVARPYVLVDPTAPEVILGYFTLSTLSVQLTGLPVDVRARLPKYPEVPALLMGRLAVAKAHQREGLGGELLRRALDRCWQFSAHGAAASLIVVDALNKDATGFYGRYGFRGFDDNASYPQRLFLTMNTLSRARSIT